MSLNQSQQLELQNILSSDTFKAAKEEVLRMSDGSIEDLGAPEAGVKMAIEKGVRNAFRLLNVISTPRPSTDPLPARILSRTKTP